MPEMRFIGKGYINIGGWRLGRKKHKKIIYLYRCNGCKKVEHFEMYLNHVVHDCDKKIKKSLFSRIGIVFKR